MTDAIVSDLTPTVAVHLDAILKSALVEFLELDERAKDHLAGCIKRAADEQVKLVEAATPAGSEPDPGAKQASAIACEGAKQMMLTRVG